MKSLPCTQLRWARAGFLRLPPGDLAWMLNRPHLDPVWPPHLMTIISSIAEPRPDFGSRGITERYTPLDAKWSRISGIQGSAGPWECNVPGRLKSNISPQEVDLAQPLSHAKVFGVLALETLLSPSQIQLSAFRPEKCIPFVRNSVSCTWYLGINVIRTVRRA
jgi:hypothetical protein